jgi:hypothetical protein
MAGKLVLLAGMKQVRRLRRLVVRQRMLILLVGVLLMLAVLQTCRVPLIHLVMVQHALVLVLRLHLLLMVRLLVLLLVTRLLLVVLRLLLHLQWLGVELLHEAIVVQGVVVVRGSRSCSLLGGKHDGSGIVDH